MTKISDRVRMIIENEKVTPNKFSQNLGYERSQTIHDILNSKSNPSYDFFYRFAKSEYSEFYDLHWLVTGEGEMLKPKVQDQPVSPSAHEPQSAESQCKDNESNPMLAEASENIKSLIGILNRTLIEKDKQIDRLLSIIEQGKV